MEGERLIGRRSLWRSRRFDNQIQRGRSLKDRRPKLTQEEICDLNGPVSSKDSESIINNLPKQEASGPGGCGGESYQISVEEIVPILYGTLESRSRGNTPRSRYEAGINYPNAKTGQEITRKLQTATCHKRRCRNPQCNISRSNPTTYKQSYAQRPR